MHILVGINNNVEEWKNALSQNDYRPRLPLPYAFGAAFAQRGHQLSSIDFASDLKNIESSKPFEQIYDKSEVVRAITNVDLAILWAGQGISAALKQPLAKLPHRRVILASYVWSSGTKYPWKQAFFSKATQIAANFTKGVIVMTSEQYELARKKLAIQIPIIKLTCGIDTNFYRVPSNLENDVPEKYREITERLLRKPYTIMLGDMERCNQDALEIIEHTNLQFVRISQGNPEHMKSFLKQIHDRHMSDRCFVFHGITYPFLRFLLQHAAVYTGLVNSTWQPAGWTVACEALASGIPVILYEGLVSRELKNIGANDFLRVVPMGDIEAFRRELQSLIFEQPNLQLKHRAQEFAKQYLNCEITGNSLVREIESIGEPGLTI